VTLKFTRIPHYASKFTRASPQCTCCSHHHGS